MPTALTGGWLVEQSSFSKAYLRPRRKNTLVVSKDRMTLAFALTEAITVQYWLFVTSGSVPMINAHCPFWPVERLFLRLLSST
jgi:hypothetical protein